MRGYLRLTLGTLVVCGLASLGSWWQLLDAIKWREQEFAYWSERPPMACPFCGEPLHRAPPSQLDSGVELYCPYDGWQYPRDWVRDERL